ncbi:uncharacterized protein DUF1540 [Nocardia ignorata]|uniref:Uncharacterized protein DUF1540 n=1 Tax=Nocardia ignorata TaxID=145285 RepID=A0A4R6PAD9_NOCIG|nr:uncharacterized protein DUF1540 [Nocardia ignorata]
MQGGESGGGRGGDDRIEQISSAVRAGLFGQDGAVETVAIDDDDRTAPAAAERSLAGLVFKCTVSDCSYNHDGCHAYAINVADHNGSADCGTFIPLSIKGGLDTVTSMVGACQRADCLHNRHLECAASDTHVGPGEGEHTARCLTYSAR